MVIIVLFSDSRMLIILIIPHFMAFANSFLLDFCEKFLECRFLSICPLWDVYKDGRKNLCIRPKMKNFPESLQYFPASVVNAYERGSQRRG